MARRPKKIHESRELLELPGYRIPLRIITEAGRSNTRASVTSRALIVRLPHFLSPQERKDGLRSMIDWAKDTLRKSPAAFAPFKLVAHSGRYTFSFRGTEYGLSVLAHDFQHHKIIPLEPHELEVRVNTADRRLHEGKLLPRLLAKHFANRCLPEVSARVYELNARHFRKTINEVKLSDTYSRWGSCSSRGNINLATRLLLAPPAVMDAVIIHELAHLVEANHSPRFWAQVEKALPNYREYDAWLRQHGKELLFTPTPVR